MANIFSIVWLAVRDAVKRKNENPDEPYVQENCERVLDIAKRNEPDTYEEFKDK